MEPHEGSGGWTPSPRNESAASTRIALATASEPWTISGERQLGRMTPSAM